MHKGQLSRVSVYSAAEYLDGVRTHLFSQSLFPVLPAFQFLSLTS